MTRLFPAKRAIFQKLHYMARVVAHEVTEFSSEIILPSFSRTMGVANDIFAQTQTRKI